MVKNIISGTSLGRCVLLLLVILVVAVNASNPYVTTSDNDTSEQSIPVSLFLSKLPITISRRFECTGGQQLFTVPSTVTTVRCAGLPLGRQ